MLEGVVCGLAKAALGYIIFPVHGLGSGLSGRKKHWLYQKEAVGNEPTLVVGVPLA
jgi:hypothetical protein